MLEAVVGSGLIGEQTSTRVYTRFGLGDALFQPLIASCYLLRVKFTVRVSV